MCLGTSSWTYLVGLGCLNPWSENYPQVRTIYFGMKSCVLWQWTMELSNAVFATCAVTSTNSYCRGFRHFNPIEIIMCWSKEAALTTWGEITQNDWTDTKLSLGFGLLASWTLDELTLPLEYPLTRLNKYVRMTDHINKYLAGFLIPRLFFFQLNIIVLLCKQTPNPM